jgi:RNA polymerase sigma factor for flagellar operon FliA
LNRALPTPGADLLDLPEYAGIPLEQITLVRSEAEIAEALAALLASDAIGFDTESKPTFLKGEVPTGPHLIQLATEEHAYLFAAFSTGATAALKTILESPRVLKAGFGLGNDRRDLRAKLGVEMQNVIDLGEVLRGPEHRGTVGAKKAVERFFGQRLHKSKKTGTSNWASTRLSERQMLYAANDAHVALRIYRAWAKAREVQGRQEK